MSIDAGYYSRLDVTLDKPVPQEPGKPRSPTQPQSGVAGQKVGVKQTADHIWLVSFMEYDPGVAETCRREPIDDPFGPRLSPMSPE